MKLRDLYRKADLAIRLGAAEYAGDLCEFILKTFPSDLRVRTLLGQAYLEQGSYERARHQFDLVLELDPENVAALSADGVAHSADGQLTAAVRAFERAYELNPGNRQVRDSLTRLYTQRDGNAAELSPAPAVAIVRWQLRHDALERALDAVNEFLLTHPGDVYVLLAQAEALWRSGRHDEAERCCRHLLARHPRFLKPRLILGHILSADRQREVDGIELLHVALAEDPGGVVAEPLFRESPFSPPILATALDLSLPEHLAIGPSDVDAAFEGLPFEGTDESAAEWRPPNDVLWPGEPEALDGVEGSSEELVPPVDTVLAGRDAEITTPGQAPVECLLAISCRGPLVARYGFDGFQRLERRLQTVARELAFLGTRFVVVFVDDPGSVALYEIQPIWSTDPSEIQRAIQQLDGVLTHDDRGIDGILIVGGDDVVPFFQLANPSDDDDATIRSDNPYGCLRRPFCLVPEIPVGRLPDGAGGNLSVLLRQVDTLLELRRKPLVVDTGPRLVRAGRAALGALGLGAATYPAFGCTAAPWESAAAEAFAPLAPTSSLRSSPPTLAESFQASWIARRRFLYFNLHGTLDGQAWYGQADLPPDASAVLPTAITPDQLAEVDLDAPLVFSAASFGALVDARSPSNSLALRFLGEGATAFVGSTAAAYGTTSPPLSGADLLSHCFWANLRSGARVGEALRRAKQQYLNEVLDRQGYLDGDDQKTLLEFVLFGDPLTPVFRARSGALDPADAPPADTESRSPVLLCNATGAGGARQPGPRLLRAAIEHLVDLCPEAADGAVRAYRRSACEGLCGQPGHGAGALPAELANGIIAVTARKELVTTDGTHLVKISRLTLTDDGDLTKYVVSK